MQEQTSDVAKRREAIFREPSAMVNDQRSGVVSWGVGSIWKRVPPGHDVKIAVEADGGEDVLSATGSPRF